MRGNRIYVIYGTEGNDWSKTCSVFNKYALEN